MKAMVLAAGLGTRLRPYTDHLPKPLFPILGIPAIEWVILGLRAAGVTEAIVNLHHLPAQIVRRLGSGERHGVRIVYSEEPLILGTGGGLSAVRDFFAGEDTFIVHNGDVFTDWDLGGLLALHRESGADATLGLADPPDLPEARLVEVSKGRVIGVRGKPRDTGGPRHVFSGISVHSQSVFDFLPRGEACLVRDGIIPMLDAGRPVAGVVVGGEFCDIGTPERVLELNWRLLPRCIELYRRAGLVPPVERMPGILVGRKVSIHPTAVLVPPMLICVGVSIGSGATVGPRAVLCEGAIIADGTTVGDTVVYESNGITNKAIGGDPIPVG